MMYRLWLLLLNISQQLPILHVALSFVVASTQIIFMSMSAFFAVIGVDMNTKKIYPRSLLRRACVRRLYHVRRTFLETFLALLGYHGRLNDPGTLARSTPNTTRTHQALLI
jgi:hypothetical protein